MVSWSLLCLDLVVVHTVLCWAYLSSLQGKDEIIVLIKYSAHNAGKSNRCDYINIWEHVSGQFSESLNLSALGKKTPCT